MIKDCYEMLSARQAAPETIAAEVCLTYEVRVKSRAKATTVAGEDIAWFLDRGISLRDGDILKCVDGTAIRVSAAREPVSRITSSDRSLLTKVAYHLGNRHVQLQVEENCLSYQVDHVLDEMVTLLGASVEHCQLPFQPEDGAYHDGHHHD